MGRAFLMVVVGVGVMLTQLSVAQSDAWGGLWSSGLLAEMELAWLDRDAQRVLTLSERLKPEMPVRSQARAKFLEGLAAKQQGELERSVQALNEVEALCAEGAPEDQKLIPHARYQRALALLDQGGDAAGTARPILEALRRHRYGLPGYDLQLARALLAGGDPDAALAHLAEINPGRGHDLFARRDEVLYFKGLALWRQGREAVAKSVFEQLVVKHPTSSRATAVLPFLNLQLSPARRVEMAEGFLSARDYDGAAAVLEGIDPAGSGKLAQEARYKLGYILYRLQREQPEKAIAPLKSVVAAGQHRAGDAQYTLARTYMKIGEEAQAQSAWAKLLQRFPQHARAHEGLYHQGWIPMDGERWDEAIGPFKQYLRRWPEGRRAGLSRWYVGWSHYRAGRQAAAIDAWKLLESSSKGWLERSKAMYWMAVARQEQGDARAARQRFERLRKLYPNTYYGVLAATRLGSFEATLPEPSLSAAQDAAQAWSALDELPAPLRVEVRRVRDLLHLGLLTEARRLVDPGLLRQLEKALVEQGYRRAESAEFVFTLQEEVGDVTRSYRANAMKLWRVYRQGVTQENRAIWRRAFPRPFRRIVEREAARYGISPQLIWAVMQKESMYKPNALSYADAMGLMQIIPRTGKKIAERLDEPYQDGMLFEPHRNIAYGSWYLAQLLHKFHGQLPLAIGSYNGGPVAMAGWVDENAQGDDALALDAFVEEIAYDQARGYTRKVLTILGRYSMVYGLSSGAQTKYSPGSKTSCRCPDGEDLLCGRCKVEALYPKEVTSTYRDNVNF